MTRVLMILALTGALTACGQPVAPEPADAPVVPETMGSGWSTVADGPGALSAIYVEGRRRILDLRCTPGMLEVTAHGVRPIASEERFSLGVGGEVFTLVAQDVEFAETVVAEGAVDAALLEGLAGGGPVHANYGSTNIGPTGPLAAEQAGRLADACRET